MKIQHLGTLAALTLTLGVASTPAHAAPFDQQFIDSMTMHHSTALMMAQVAATKAQYPEVRRVARAIMTDQQKEIAYMKQLRARFYPKAMANSSAVKPKMGGKMMPDMKMNGDKMQMMSGEMMGLPMKMMMDIGKLRNARGSALDRMFLKMMIPHHASAITMADEALNVSGRPEIRRLSNVIIDAQAKEIGEIHSIYDRRFGSLAKG